MVYPVARSTRSTFPPRLSGWLWSSASVMAMVLPSGDEEKYGHTCWTPSGTQDPLPAVKLCPKPFVAGTSHANTFPSAPDEYRVCPEGSNANELMGPECPFRVWETVVDETSHRRMSLSSVADASVLPSGENASGPIPPCPLYPMVTMPVRRSTNRTEMSFAWEV